MYRVGAFSIKIKKIKIGLCCCAQVKRTFSPQLSGILIGCMRENVRRRGQAKAKAQAKAGKSLNK
jgi:hypothetical protein